MRAPSGGPKDTIPPFVLGSIPRNYTKNFHGQNITILFDEFIKIKDPGTSIQISPELEKPPTIKVVQKSIQINFKTELEKNRTYTVNFGNSIIDYNEGNILKNFRYVLSTGPHLDSIKISGTVKDPLDTSTKKDIYVLIHPYGNDSDIIKKKPFLFTTTDDKGNFSLENLPVGNYNIYALQETNKNKKYDNRSERIAFLNKPIILKKDTGNIKLNLFKESDTSVQTLKKYLKDGLLRIYFNVTPDSLTIAPLDKENEKNYIVEYHGKNDTVYIWTPDLNQDSVRIIVKYGKHKPSIISQQNYIKSKKIPLLTSEDNIQGNLIAPNQILTLTFSRPVRDINADAIHIIEDSLTNNIDSIVKLDLSFRRYKIYYPWQAGKKYKLTISSGKLKDIYGSTNQGYEHAFTLGNERNYGLINLKLTIPQPGDYIVQLINEKLSPIETDYISKNTIITYKNLIPGKYRIRVVYDINRNGHYDTGNLLAKIQPESVILSKEIIIRANFEINPIFILPQNP